MTINVARSLAISLCSGPCVYPSRQQLVVTTLTSNMFNSVPKVIFLQAAVFGGSYVRIKNYKNGHKNIFGLVVVLELKVETEKFLLLK